MNPNTPQQSFELPNPQRIEGAETIGLPLEKPLAKQETSLQPPQYSAQQAPVQPLQSSTLQQTVPQAAQDNQHTTSATNPPIAEDADLIEKEWVTKAKQIVAATREDPHLQNKEINRFKADYLKKRYNKDIKVEES